jgi:hypothetical protein
LAAKHVIESLLGRMTTPQQFLESFFREKVTIYNDANVRLLPVYAKYFGEPLSKHSSDFLLLDRMREVIDKVKESASSAVIITSIQSERLASATTIRTRYHLAAIDGDWKITRIDRECLYCRVTGQSGQTPCQHCGGEGWIDQRKDVA